jgi:hypothetical protein
VVNPDIGEHTIVAAVEQVRRIGLFDAYQSGDRQRVRQLDKPFGVRIRERPEQHAVHHREHRGCAADAECERERGGRGESGSARQAARSVTDTG